MLNDLQLEQLVLAPFREIVVKATAALANADSAPDDGATVPAAMRRAARGLLAKSERALAKIEPICARLLAEYGVEFVDAVRENGRFSLVRTGWGGP